MLTVDALYGDEASGLCSRGQGVVCVNGAPRQCDARSQNSTYYVTKAILSAPTLINHLLLTPAS